MSAAGASTPSAPAGRPWAVFDIDGVLADVRHRLHHLRGPRPSWDRFFEAADRDPVLDEGRAMAWQLAGDHDVAYLTGRPAWLADVTTAWLARHGLPEGPLHMRRTGDRRPARIVKLELLVGLARTGPISLVVDDDPDVVAALREAQVPVHQATWVPYTRALGRAQEREGRT